MEAYKDSEIVIALVGAVGTDLGAVEESLAEGLAACDYDVSVVRISKQVIPIFRDVPDGNQSEYERIAQLMTLGDQIREQTKNHAAMALGCAALIASDRMSDKDDGGFSQVDEGAQQDNAKDYLLSPRKRNAYIINSLKRPEEVEELRDIYDNGFYLLGVYSDEVSRLNYLTRNGRMTKANATELMTRDEDEGNDWGQLTRDTFHLADYFVHDRNKDARKNSVWRFCELLFGHPYRTPTFDEFAMFTAFTSALRSADLSRQVGAVIARNEEILATGANECPRFGGGLYWSRMDSVSGRVIDKPEGRDFKRGFDSNALEKELIVSSILNDLKDCLRDDCDNDFVKRTIAKSRLRDITEYGRVVHAEMEAILACARNNIDCRGAVLYCTTFPCHNCAKHIIAAGIERVVYVEPYPKSKAPEFHDDSIVLGFQPDRGKKTSTHVGFEPFVGVGPRNFITFFSVGLGSGYKIERKQNGRILPWKTKNARLRNQMLPYSYLERELKAATEFNSLVKSKKSTKGQVGNEHGETEIQCETDSDGSKSV